VLQVVDSLQEIEGLFGAVGEDRLGPHEAELAGPLDQQGDGGVLHVEDVDPFAAEHFQQVPGKGRLLDAIAAPHPQPPAERPG
jgi:hypothetical protein